MPVVADTYDLLVGVDTHAASHTFALIDATTGALADTREFPTSPAGLRRAQSWIQRHTGTRRCLVLVDGAGSYGAVLTGHLITAGFTVAEAPDIPAQVRRAAGKTDSLDAAELARAARGLTEQQLRWPRHAADRTILRVLTTARDQMTAERTRTVNALTALLRTVDLDVDARRALSTTTISTIASWRTPTTTVATRTICRAEAIRLARRIRALDSELTANHTALTAAVTAQPPTCSQSAASARSSQQRCSMPGHTPVASTPKPRSPPWPESPHYRPPQATPSGTASTAAATAALTEPSTPSP